MCNRSLHCNEPRRDHTAWGQCLYKQIMWRQRHRNADTHRGEEDRVNGGRSRHGASASRTAPVITGMLDVRMRRGMMLPPADSLTSDFLLPEKPRESVPVVLSHVCGDCSSSPRKWALGVPGCWSYQLVPSLCEFLKLYLRCALFYVCAILQLKVKKRKGKKNIRHHRSLMGLQLCRSGLLGNLPSSLCGASGVLTQANGGPWKGLLLVSMGLLQSSSLSSEFIPHEPLLYHTGRWPCFQLVREEDAWGQVWRAPSALPHLLLTPSLPGKWRASLHPPRTSLFLWTIPFPASKTISLFCKVLIFINKSMLPLVR